MKKFYFFLLLLISVSIQCLGQDQNGNQIQYETLRNGFGLGSVLAVVTSWERNKSILFAIIHGFFSWIYVIYFVLTRTKTERKNP